MLQKSERLKEKHLFNVAFSLGKKKKQKFSTNLLSLYYLFGKKDINKSAFVVGVKIDKRATKRNLIKRRMISAYKLIKKINNGLNGNKASVLIWVAHPEIKNATFEQIKDSMDKLLNKLRLDNKR